MDDFIFFEPDVAAICAHADDTVMEMMRETDRSDDNPVWNELIDIYSHLHDICSIRGGYVILDVANIDASTGIITCADGRLIAAQRKVCAYMKGADKIAVFISTAGENFTTLTKKYNNEGEYLKGFITDSFGSVIAERSIDFINSFLEADMNRQALLITNRYSPGYCNWPLFGQKQLFELLPPNQCRISLTDSMLMQPIKSVSGIIGIGKNVKKSPYACDVCADKNCIYRKILSSGNTITI